MTDPAELSPEQLATAIWARRKDYRADPFRCDCRAKESRPFAVIYFLPGGQSVLWVAGERSSDGWRSQPRAYPLFAGRPPILDQTRAVPCGHSWAIRFDSVSAEVTCERFNRLGRFVIVDSE